MFYYVALSCAVVSLCRGVVSWCRAQAKASIKRAEGDGRGAQVKTRQDKRMNGAAIAVRASVAPVGYAEACLACLVLSP